MFYSLNAPALVLCMMLSIAGTFVVTMLTSDMKKELFGTGYSAPIVALIFTTYLLLFSTLMWLIVPWARVVRM